VSDSEHKQCPDCAEQVLVAARKCRYCGYRFDGGRRDSPSPFSDLFSRRRSAAQFGTLPEILADWGFNLRDGEDIGFFRAVALDDRPGYLLVSAQRFVFFQQGWRREYRKVVEFPLSELVMVQTAHRVLGRQLELHGRDFRHILDGLQATELKRVASYLTQQRAARQRNGEP
jgi:hypothetical protein